MKKLISLLLCVVMLLSICVAVPFSVSAMQVDVAHTSVVSGDYEYKVLSDGTAQITRYNGSDEVLVIPSKIDGITVTVLGTESFDRKTFKQVTIPDTVTIISSYAFTGCDSITEITIPDSVTEIQRDAFNSCDNLKTVVIGDSVEIIEKNAFYDCGSLKNVTFGSSVQASEQLISLIPLRVSAVVLFKTVNIFLISLLEMV